MQRHVSLLFSSLLFSVVADKATAQVQPPQLRYSTHDWTVPLPPPTPVDFGESWADAKSPGNGLVYLVGTIEVIDTNSTASAPLFFSGRPVFPPQNWTTFTYQPIIGGTRQIVVLQIVDPAEQNNPVTDGIVQQRFFYGAGIGNPPIETGSSNARGISVWPAPTVADTRIAICGESYDRDLPLSQAPTSAWQTANGNLAAGFIAVYDGAANLLWTHHFFTDRRTGTPGNSHAAITDICIRVECDANGDPMTDVVTYCGVSSHGNPPPGVPPPPFSPDALQPVAPFIAPAGSGSCQSPADGAVDNGTGQWDGIVGRLSRPHDPSTGSTTVEFHSIVGGTEQDGLFGIDEIDSELFVVVGSTGLGSSTSSGTGLATFPFTDQTSPAAAPGNYALGVAMVFNASNVLPGGGGALELLSSQALGTLNDFTVARDVHIVPEWSTGLAAIRIVGSTSDSGLLTQLSVAYPSPPASVVGGADGFLLGGVWFGVVPSAIVFLRGTFSGLAGQDGLTGVRGWSEFADHVCVTGFVGPAVNTDLVVRSYYANTSSSGTMNEFVALTQSVVGGAGIDLPAAQGADRSTVVAGQSGSVVFDEFGLGDPAGGGIAVDETARVNVVGATQSLDFPVVGGRARRGVQADGVRATLDLIPDGVGRTDGTGVAPPGGLGFPSYPLPGFFGGTTPDCALLAFGPQIGLPTAANSLPRMLIDFEGTMGPGSTDATILVIRPPDNAGSNLVALHLDFPGAASGGGPPYQPIVLLPEGVLLWTTNSGVANAVGAVPDTTLRFPLSSPMSPLPVGPLTVSVQLVCLLGTPVAAGVSPNCSGASLLAGSPALWFSY